MTGKRSQGHHQWEYFATLTVTGEDVGSWSLLGATVINCGQTIDTGTGCFNITNPFGTTAINSILFEAVSVTPRPYVPNDSDYSLGAIAFTDAPGDTVPAPEPGSMLLLGTGLLGVGRAARRRFRATR